MGPFAFLLLLLAPAQAQAAECLTFGKLVPAFAAEYEIEPKRAKIRFTPLNLALASSPKERAAYLLADQESCGMRGDCDSVVYLKDQQGCYVSVLSFRGKWRGVERKRGRELASVEIESRVEGDAVPGNAVFRIGRLRRRFEYVPDQSRYEEVK